MSLLFESERLAYRELTPKDADMFYDLNSDAEVMRYTGDRAFVNIAEAEKFLLQYKEYKKHGFGRWACIRKSDQAFIGWCGLKKHTDYVDLGYRFFKSEWGKGYATEAAKASLKYGFEHLSLPSLVGRVAQDNHASIRVLQKIGMKFWKTGGCGEFADAHYYKIDNNII